MIDRLDLPAVLIVLVVTLGCQQGFEAQCDTSEHCPDGHFCQLGDCVDLNANGSPPLENSATDDSDSPHSSPEHAANATGDASAPTDDSPPHPCPDAPGADPQSIILNEFMANVPAGDAGDANQDGVRHFHDDEFVELVNISEHTVDMTGLQLQNDGDERFTFPPFCLDGLHAVVVFGGLEDGADPPSGEGFESIIADSWFRYAQGGGRIVVEAADGAIIADHTYGSHPEGSLNRWPELDNGEFKPHRDLHDDQPLFSPGTCADGRPFTTGCVPTAPPPAPSNHSDAKPGGR